MSEEKSELGGISQLQFEDAAAGLRDSPDIEPDGGSSVAAVEGVDPQPQLALSVASTASQCSEDPAEMTEAVYLGRLEPQAAIRFKAHVEACPRCLPVYKETVAFVDAIRAAATWLDSGHGSKPD